MNIGTPAATVIHYLFQYPFTALIVILIISADTIRFKKAVPYLVSFWAYTLFFSIGKKLIIEGNEHIKPDQSQIVVANHASIYDIPALMAVFPGYAFIGREHLLRIPVFGRLLKTINYIPINPGKLHESFYAISYGTKTLEQGISVLIFPEGTRTRNGEIGSFKRGFVKILKETESAVQPVTLNGFYSLKPKGSHSVCTNEQLKITVHPALCFSSIKNTSDKKISDTIRSIVASEYSVENRELK